MFMPISDGIIFSVIISYDLQEAHTRNDMVPSSHQVSRNSPRKTETFL